MGQRAIDDECAQSFVTNGVALARGLFGNPAMPVGQVLLWHSPCGCLFTVRRDNGCAPSQIVLSSNPCDRNFYFQLAQEIPHLLNTKMRDIYVEGSNLVFARTLFRHAGKEWDEHEQYLRHDAGVYGAAYQLMRDVWTAAGEEHIQRMLTFAVDSEQGANWQRIDIDGWIDSLPNTVREKVLETICQNYSDVRTKLDASTGMPDYAFHEPAACGDPSPPRL